MIAGSVMAAMDETASLPSSGRSRGPAGQNLRRIFVVGCPRSGTTLLQSLLAAHQDLAAFTESHFFTIFFNHRAHLLYRISEGLGERIKAFLAENGAEAFASEIHAPRSRVLLLPQAAREVRAITAIFDRIARSRDAAGWIEKTPNNVLRLPLLSYAHRDARFVHIIREPETTLPSLMKAQAQWAPDGASTWEDAANNYAQALKASLAHARDPRHMLVLYRTVVTDTEKAATTILQRLGLDVSTYDYRTYKQAAASLITKDESWKGNNLSEISLRGNDRKLEDLPAGIVRRYKVDELYRRAVEAASQSR